MKTTTYKDAGVDIEIGDEASKIMFEASRASWEIRKDVLGKVISESFHFGALRYVNTPEIPDLVIGLNSDGVGTKIELAERLSNHGTIAFDLFAMVCDDAAAMGAEPILITSVLDFNTVDIQIVKQLAEGMLKASKKAGVCVINGEIAELGNRVSGYKGINYNWSATALWAARKSRLRKHISIKPGTNVVAIKEDGIRSNGLSLVRKIMTNTYGDNWHELIEDKEMIKWVLLPSIIYTPLIVKIHGGYHNESIADIDGAIHVTGGGVPGKLGRALYQNKLGAKLNNLFEPPPQINTLQDLGNVSDKECYKTWNMGQGLLILCRDPEPIIELAQKMEYEARLAGEIVDGNEITLISKGAEKPGQALHFPV